MNEFEEKKNLDDQLFNIKPPTRIIS